MPRQAKKKSISLILKSFRFYCYIDAYITMSEPSAIILSMLEHWTKLSKTHYLSRTSLHSQYTENVKDWADIPLTFSQMQQSCPDETYHDDKAKTFWCPDMSRFSFSSLLKSQKLGNISWSTFIFRITAGLEFSFCLM